MNIIDIGKNEMFRNELKRLGFIKKGSWFVKKNQNINTTRPIPVDNKGHFAPYDDGLLAHEYGHYLQSQRYSWGYLFSHGMPSLINDVKTKDKTVGYKGIYLPEHRLYWTERDANNKANNYFQKHGYLGSWPYIKYPL